VLPLRPEDFSGLLIADVNFEEKFFQFGPRFGGGDFNKGRQKFSCPFPEELLGLLSHCVGSRAGGPVLRRREIFEGRRQPRVPVDSAAEVERHVESALRNAAPGELQSPQDYKRGIRACLRRMGGMSEDSQAKEFKQLFAKAGQGGALRPYDLRGSINTEMENAGVSLLVQRYVTGHRTNDIQNHYVSLDPALQMRKYFDRLAPLFAAIKARAAEVGLPL
jgi:integrase